MTPDQNPPWNKQDPANKQGGPPAWVGAKQPTPDKEWNKQDPAWVGAKQPPPDKSLLLQTELEAAIKADHKKPWREEATYPELQKALAAPEEITGTQILSAMMIGFAGGYKGDTTAGAKFMTDMIQKREDLAWVKADARSMYEIDPSSLSPEMLRGLAEGTYKDRGSWVAAKSSYRAEVAKAKAKQSDSRTEVFLRESSESIDYETLSPGEKDSYDRLKVVLGEPGTLLTSQDILNAGAHLEHIQKGVASREIVVERLSRLSDEEALNLYSQLADGLEPDELLSIQDAQNPKKVREYLEGKAQDFSHSDVVVGFTSAELAQNSRVRNVQREIEGYSDSQVLSFMRFAKNEDLPITVEQAKGQESIPEEYEARFLNAKASRDAYVARDMERAKEFVAQLDGFTKDPNIDVSLWVMDEGTWTSTDSTQKKILGTINGFIQEALNSPELSVDGREMILKAEAEFHATMLGQQQAKVSEKTSVEIQRLMAEHDYTGARELLEELSEGDISRVIMSDGKNGLEVFKELSTANAGLANLISQAMEDPDISEGGVGSLWSELNDLIDLEGYNDAKSDSKTPIDDPMSHLKPNQKFGLMEVQDLARHLKKEKEAAGYRTEHYGAIEPLRQALGEIGADPGILDVTLDEFKNTRPEQRKELQRRAEKAALRAINDYAEETRALSPALPNRRSEGSKEFFRRQHSLESAYNLLGQSPGQGTGVKGEGEFKAFAKNLHENILNLEAIANETALNDTRRTPTESDRDKLASLSEMVWEYKLPFDPSKAPMGYVAGSQGKRGEWTGDARGHVPILDTPQQRQPWTVQARAQEATRPEVLREISESFYELITRPQEKDVWDDGELKLQLMREGMNPGEADSILGPRHQVASDQLSNLPKIAQASVRNLNSALALLVSGELSGGKGGSGLFGKKWEALPEEEIAKFLSGELGFSIDSNDPTELKKAGKLFHGLAQQFSTAFTRRPETKSEDTKRPSRPIDERALIDFTTLLNIAMVDEGLMDGLYNTKYKDASEAPYLLEDFRKHLKETMEATLENHKIAAGALGERFTHDKYSGEDLQVGSISMLFPDLASNDEALAFMRDNRGDFDSWLSQLKGYMTIASAPPSTYKVNKPEPYMGDLGPGFNPSRPLRPGEKPGAPPGEVFRDPSRDPDATEPLWSPERIED